MNDEKELNVSSFIDRIADYDLIKKFSDAVDRFDKSIDKLELLLDNKTKVLKPRIEMERNDLRMIEEFTEKYLMITNKSNDFISVEDLKGYYKVEYKTIAGFRDFTAKLYSHYGLETDNKNVKQEYGGYKSYRCVLGILDKKEVVNE
jgi:hypothetical protein